MMIIPPWLKGAALAVALVGMYLFGRGDGKAIGRIELQAYQAQVARANAQSAADARAKEQSFQQQLNEARNAAVERETKLRADADRARAESGRLRDTIAAIRRDLPSLTREAVERYANAASVVFTECTDAYQRLAEQADRIDSDRQTLEQAWPQERAATASHTR